ncbi:MAG: indole-3-glycerol-phosphate synthase TrpC [Gammaproteobacteria bacterium]|nr:indole-3-glycerol-phosphate synthase TrpC [Gammaproteobacteria bacterium]
MPDAPLLDRMAAASRRRAAAARALEPEGALLARASVTEDPPVLRLDRFDVIAELKLRSPAMGALAQTQFDLEEQVTAYATGGAATVSVLTEPDEFKGSLEHLEQAVTLLRPHGIPVMRKDFLTEPYQVLEARAAGAGGVLVIAAMLSDTEMEALVDCARECGLYVLLEAFDESDLERIGELAAIKPQSSEAPVLVGVNSRNLRTLAVDFARFAELAPRLPAGLPAVAESGIETTAQLREVAELGYNLALVGSALMLAGSPVEQLASFVTTGREHARGKRECS